MIHLITNDIHKNSSSIEWIPLSNYGKDVCMTLDVYYAFSILIHAP
jgi:hypothetical protein